MKCYAIILLLISTGFAHAQTDSVMYQRDSAIIPDKDPTVQFFEEAEKLADPAKTIVVTRSMKTQSLSAFLKTAGMYAQHGLADLDKDGRKELLVSNYTGGAHCCDEIYVFKYIAPGKYQHVAKLYAGNTEIIEGNEFAYNLYEQFGYFFTCYACSYTDTSDTAPVEVRNILLRYNRGRVTIVPGDKELRSSILDNLGKLGEQPYEKLEDAGSFDNGLRKEFAINLAVFYFSFGKNMVETQKLFRKFYRFPDANKVWASFTRQIQYMKKENDF